MHNKIWHKAKKYDDKKNKLKPVIKKNQVIPEDEKQRMKNEIE